jgi:hypothetical protein
LDVFVYIFRLLFNFTNVDLLFLQNFIKVYFFLLNEIYFEKVVVFQEVDILSKASSVEIDFEIIILIFVFKTNINIQILRFLHGHREIINILCRSLDSKH